MKAMHDLWRYVVPGKKPEGANEDIRCTPESKRILDPPKAENGETVNSEKIEFAMRFLDTLSELDSHLHASDNPKDIAHWAMKLACEYYQADWCGYLSIDLDLGLWTPYWWYNVNLKDRTMKLTGGYEWSAYTPRWKRAMKMNCKLAISDTAAIKDEDPEEYQIYECLNIRSLLAVPVKPRPIGFFVVRNPQRYGDDEKMLRMLAYIVSNVVTQHSYYERAKMSLSPEAIQSDKDIIVNFFGDLNIYTSKGVWREQDFNSPKCARLVAFLLLNRKIAHPPLEIAAALWPNDTSSPETICRNIRGLIYRFRQAFSLISDFPLIESTSNGYRINRNLRIMTDIQQFDNLYKLIQNTATSAIKLDLMREAITLYRGPLFECASSEHWIMPKVHTYNLLYIGLVNDFLGRLADSGDYTAIHQYACKALEVMPGNIRAYYWQVFATYHSGAIEMAKSEVACAKIVLTEEEYATLINYLKKNPDMAPLTQFDDEYGG